MEVVTTEFQTKNLIESIILVCVYLLAARVRASLISFTGAGTSVLSNPTWSVKVQASVITRMLFM